MKFRKILLLVLAILIFAFFIFELGQYLSLEYLRDRYTDITDYRRSYPIHTAIIFFIIYITVTGLSLPSTGIMTLAGGAIFGLIWGTILVSFASSIGATVAFLAARFLFKDYVQARFSNNLKTINKGIEEDGALYLFMLRLVPIFPFFIINLVMALTPIRTVIFYLVSQIGMLAVTIIFVFAGTQLAAIRSLGDILSLKLIGSLILLGLFPLLAKKLVMLFKSKRKLSSLPMNSQKKMGKPKV